MSAKSRRGKQKGSSQSKKKRNIRRGSQVAVARLPVVASPQNVIPSDEPSDVSEEIAAHPLAAMSTVQAVSSYPNLPYELRRIGILAGIILAILILLVLILS